ncbi:MAG: glycosyltransferase [Pseudomonadales bacterium]
MTAPETLFWMYPEQSFGYLSMFWHAIVFEVPRFVIAGFAVFVVEFTRTMRSARERPTASPEQRIRVSLLLAGHNEGACLEKAIAALQEQTYRNFEIIVVDDGSTDDMADVGRRLFRDGRIDRFLSTGIRGGKSAAANYGLTFCTGDVVMIADIDTTFDRDALALVLQPFSDASVGAVSGNLAVRNLDATLVTRFQAIQYLTSISLGRRVTDMLGTLFIASGAFAAFRREALIGVGGWEVGPGEDADITVKLRRAGWKIRFRADAWALTDVPESALALFRQRLRWNRSLVRVRLRKFANVFNPFRENFSFADAYGHFDILFYQGVMPLSFYVYLCWLVATYGVAAFFVLAAVSLVYIGASVFSFLIAVGISGHYGHLRLLPYVPGYALFNAYLLRAVSVYSYLDEFFLRKSYQDTYVPRRVLDAADKY